MKYGFILLSSLIATVHIAHARDVRAIKDELIHAVHDLRLSDIETVLQPYLKPDDLTKDDAKILIQDINEVLSVVNQLIAETSAQQNHIVHALNAIRVGLTAALATAAVVLVPNLKWDHSENQTPKPRDGQWFKENLSFAFPIALLVLMGARELHQVVKNVDIHQQRAQLLAIKEVLHQVKAILLHKQAA